MKKGGCRTLICSNGPNIWGGLRKDSDQKSGPRLGGLARSEIEGFEGFEGFGGFEGFEGFGGFAGDRGCQGVGVSGDGSALTE